MRGMSADKSGAAAVAGVFAALASAKPRHIRATALLAFVVNDISATSYRSDEVLLARSGRLVGVLNTDAEGRLPLSDLLCKLKEEALASGDRQALLFSLATLTGHAKNSFGDYSVAIGNGVAERAEVPRLLRDRGEELGDCFEVSRLRLEDYEAITVPNKVADVLQIAKGRKAERGHQVATAFLVRASGLEDNDIGSDKPLPYVHLDIAGSASPTPFEQTHSGRPTVGLADFVMDYVLRND